MGAIQIDAIGNLCNLNLQGLAALAKKDLGGFYLILKRETKYSQARQFELHPFRIQSFEG
jgi:hypothetical protein